MRRGEGGGGVEAWGGEENEPQVVEGADVEGKQEVREECEEHVAGEDASEGEFLLGASRGGEGCRGCDGRGGRTRFEVITLSARSVNVLVMDGRVLRIAAVEDTAEEGANGVRDAEAKIRFIPKRLERLVCVSKKPRCRIAVERIYFF